MKSIWQETIEKPSFPALAGDIKTEVLIVGGGMAGLLCGYMLSRAGVDCIIAEARTICDGTTRNTTAKITCHHGAIFDKMIARYGLEAARLYVKAHTEAVEQYRELARGIDCDFEETTSCVYSRTDRFKMEKEVLALKRLGVPVGFREQLPLPFPVAGAVTMRGQAQFHPLKFAYALAKDLPIFENTEVTALTADGAITPHGRIHAEKTIVATHFPFSNRHGLYFVKLYQHRSYVLVLEGAPAVQGMYVDEADTGLSFRSYGNRLLLGGGGHRTGKSGGGWRELSAFAATHYPEARVVGRYAAQDCQSLDDIAYIGPYSPHTPSLYVATGFNKWGMSSAMVAASLLSDLIRGKPNPYAAIFNPARSLWHPQLLVNAGESVKGLLTPRVPRCTHLGCALTYNKQEHSWDCACHGSRFAEDGRRMDNPAQKDLKPHPHQ